MEKIFLTIFTPTYNRAYILSKLYESLCNQIESDCNYEWLIIDDDSSDNTRELVEKWKNNKNQFNIRYYHQNHGGKHRALNKAFDLAEGEFLFIVDSDDWLKEDAVKSIFEWTNTIKDTSNFAGVAGLRISNRGNVWGGDVKYSDSYVDATTFERRKYNLLGDKAEVFKTEILKQFKFPEFPDEYFVTEDYCWLQISAAGYKIRWYNYPIYVCEYLDDGLTKTGANSVEGHVNNYQGYIAYIKKCLELKPFFEKMIHLREYNGTMRAIKKPFFKRGKDIGLSSIQYMFKCFFEVPMVCILRRMGL